MTKISYIHGIGQVDTSEFKDRGQLVPGQSYINYTALTDGELRLTLLAEQANILASMYPENKEIQKSKNILVDALYRGVHRYALPGGIFTGQVADVVAEVRRARQNTAPASGFIFGRQNMMSGIGDPLIPYEDCEQYQENEYGEMKPTGNFDQSCLKKNALKKILNDGLEKSSHHIMYEFVSNPNEQPSLVAVKTQSHRASTAIIGKVVQVKRDDIRLWERNGVLRRNAQAGLGAIQPEGAIGFLKKEASMNGIGAVEAAVVIGILKLIGLAISAAATLIMAFKQQDPNKAGLFNELQGIGTGVFGPELEDWQKPPGTPPPGGGGDGGGSSDLLNNELAIPLLVGAGAYLLLK